MFTGAPGGLVKETKREIFELKISHFTFSKLVVKTKKYLLVSLTSTPKDCSDGII
jgi:hypothetical protein